MARPDSKRLTQRVQVQVAATPAPDVGVYAPLDVKAAPSKSALALQGLAESLGAVLNTGQAVKQFTDKKMYEQGVADQTFGKVSERKRKFIESYSRGVYEASVINHYNEAERSVVEKAANELDRTLPLEEQARQIDSWMKDELGAVALDDPRARKLIAERYNTFIQNTTNKILEQTTSEQQQKTLDATLVDVVDDINKGGDGRIAAAVERIAMVSGDRQKALAQVIGGVISIAQQTANEGDPNTAEAQITRVFSLIPKEIKMEDGTVLRPRASPSIAATISDQYRASMDQAKRRRIDAAQETMLQYGKQHEDATNAGEILPWAFYEDLANRDVISDAQALAWYDENQAAYTRAQQKKGADSMIDQWLLDPSADWRWHTGLTLPDGKIATQDKFQERFDFIMQNALAKGGPEAFPTVLAMSRRTGIVYTPMKTALSQVSGANVETIADYFDTYQQLRAAGMAEAYITDKAMPYWLVAEAMNQTGVDPRSEKGKAQLRDRLTRLEPERVQEYVNAGRQEVRKLMDSQVVNDEGINTTVGGLANAAYARSEIMRLASLNMQLQVDPKTSLQSAVKQIAATHFPLEVDGEEFLIPNEPGIDKKNMQDAMDYFTENVLPQYAAKEGRTRDEVRFEIARLGGRETEIRVVDMNGNNIASNGKFWTPAELMSMYRDISARNAADSARGRQERGQAMKKIMQDPRQIKPTSVVPGLGPSIPTQ